MIRRPASDLYLHNLLRRCWAVPEAYEAFCALVWPFLVATLCYYDGNPDRVNEACQEALYTLKSELQRDWDDKRNYLLKLIALAHETESSPRQCRAPRPPAVQLVAPFVLVSACGMRLCGRCGRCGTGSPGSPRR